MIQNTNPYQNEPTWSRPERAIAHRVSDGALKRELQQIIEETRQRANQISVPDDLWDLEHYLSQRRKEINSKYDSRSSRLTGVLGRLLCEERVSEDELRGLGEDKLRIIRSCARVLSET